MTDFNLQLFVDSGYPVVQVTTANSDGNNLSAEMKTFYDKQLIEEASAQLVYDQFGQKRPIPKGAGKTIEFRKFSNLPKATTALTEGVTPNGKSLNVSTITATVSQYGDYIVQSDMLELTAIDNTIVEATKLLGRQAGLTLDTITRNVLCSTATAYYASGAANAAALRTTGIDSTTKISVKDVAHIVALLRAQNAPTINGDYVAVIHPYVAHDLMRDSEWIDAHKYAAPENLYNGEIGKIAGVRFVQTSEAMIEKGADDTLAIFDCIFMGQGAYGTTEITGGGLETIVKQKGYGEDPLNQRSSVGWKATKTAKILVPNYIYRYVCLSSFSSTASAN